MVQQYTQSYNISHTVFEWTRSIRSDGERTTENDKKEDVGSQTEKTTQDSTKAKR